MQNAFCNLDSGFCLHFAESQSCNCELRRWLRLRFRWIILGSEMRRGLRLAFTPSIAFRRFSAARQSACRIQNPKLEPTICRQNTKSKIRANNLLAEYKIQNPSQQSAGRMQMLKQFGRMSRQEQNSSLQNVERNLYSPSLSHGGACA